MPEQSKQQPGAADQDEWPFDEPWPFADDLDDYERELEALYQPRDWRSDPGREERLARQQEMARIALENGSYGPVPEGVDLPAGWVEYVRNGRTPTKGDVNQSAKQQPPAPPDS